MARRRRRVRAWVGRGCGAGLASALAAAALVACGSSPGETDIGYPDDYRLLATSPADTAPTESVEGRLSTGQDNCLGLVQQDGGSIVVSWPEGTEWLDGRSGIRLPDGQELRMAAGPLEAAGLMVSAGSDEHEMCPGASDVFMLSSIKSSA